MPKTRQDAQLRDNCRQGSDCGNSELSPTLVRAGTPQTHTQPKVRSTLQPSPCQLQPRWWACRQSRWYKLGLYLRAGSALAQAARTTLRRTLAHLSPDTRRSRAATDHGRRVTSPAFDLRATLAWTPSLESTSMILVYMAPAADCICGGALGCGSSNLPRRCAAYPRLVCSLLHHCHYTCDTAWLCPGSIQAWRCVRRPSLLNACCPVHDQMLPAAGTAIYINSKFIIFQV